MASRPYSISIDRIEGMVTSERADVIKGWAWIPERPEQRVEIEALIDGEVVWTGRADRPRPDLEGLGKGGASCGFRFVIPDALKIDRQISVCLRERTSGWVLDGGHVTVGPYAIGGDRQAAEIPTYIESDVSEPRNGVIKGWAWNPRRPSQHLDIEVLHKGQVIGVVKADRFRADLQEKGKGQGDHAFKFGVPERFKAGKPVRLLFRERLSGQALRRGDVSTAIPPPPSPGSRPRYAESEVPTLRAIWALNERMDWHVRRNRAGWLMQALHVSLRADCLETAYGLARYVNCTFSAYSEPAQMEFLPLMLAAYASCGDVAGIDALLARRPEFIKRNDEIFSHYSLRRLRSGLFEADLMELPSGGLNACYADRAALTQPDEVEAYLIEHPHLVHAHPDNRFLLANVSAAKGGCAAYVEHLNAALAANGLAFRAALKPGPDGGHLINRITFLGAAKHAPDGPLVSVIMAAQNTAATIEAAVDSILQQTHQRLELLVCDDASGDGTAQLLRRRYGADRRVRLFRSEAAQGPYNIRNHLLKEAKGAFVTFQDADDVSCPERLATQLAAFAGNPKLSLVYSTWIRLGPSGRAVFFADQKAIRMASVSVMGPKRVFDECGPYDRVLFGADSELIDRVRCLHGQAAVSVIAKPLLFGGWMNDSLTRRAGSQATEDGFRAEARRLYAERRFRDRLAEGYWAEVDDLPNAVTPAPIHPLSI